jgi:hypothetical protein
VTAVTTVRESLKRRVLRTLAEHCNTLLWSEPRPDILFIVALERAFRLDFSGCNLDLSCRPPTRSRHGFYA